LKIRVKIHFNGESETHYPKVKLFSDVIPEPLTYSVIQTLPHNPLAYTQGYFFKDDTLIESTGQNGTSWLSKVNLQTGLSYTKVSLDPEYFGEGSAFWGGNYYQLTWTSQTGFVYDASFNQLKTFSYTHEGWGMATWGDTLLVSDGTEVIHFLDPRDLSEIDRLEVYEGTKPLKNLNELEVVDGLLYANIYPEDEVAVIELATGRVLKIADLSGLLTSSESRQADVLNGIAKHPNGKLYFTGKLWPKTFELQLTPKPN
jgi:glutamine cyclotransferase